MKKMLICLSIVCSISSSIDMCHIGSCIEKIFTPNILTKILSFCTKGMITFARPVTVDGGCQANEFVQLKPSNWITLFNEKEITLFNEKEMIYPNYYEVISNRYNGIKFESETMKEKIIKGNTIIERFILKYKEMLGNRNILNLPMKKDKQQNDDNKKKKFAYNKEGFFAYTEKGFHQYNKV
jgi:hypothetical protein